jgi:hypothetical protein
MGGTILLSRRRLHLRTSTIATTSHSTAGRTLKLLLVLMAAGGALAPAAAQQQERTDSLEREIRELKARLDSLQRLLEELIRLGRDTAEVSDELAALRAAAQAAGEAGAQQDTTTQESRSRNLSILNPEISVTGDVVGYYLNADGEDGSFGAVPREFEFSFQAAVDPYTRTKVFVTYEEEVPIAGFPEDEEGDEHGNGRLHLEEGYLYWVGLPANLGLKVGKFRQEIGNYNRWHTHALFEVDRPLPSVVFLGEDGLIQTGLDLVSPSLTIGPSTTTAFFELTAGTNEALFRGSGEPSYLGRVLSFWDLSPSTYLQVGGTGTYGQNSGDTLETTLYELDFAFRWAPPGRALYQDFQLKGEWYWVKQAVNGAGPWRRGGWAQANYRAGRRWIFGARADYLSGAAGEPDIVQLVPTISWWQSEWVRLRLQYNYLKPEDGGGNHTVLLQFVWAIGPHRHESY